MTKQHYYFITEYFGVITGHITVLGNINVAFGISFSAYQYITNFLSESDANDTPHNLATLLTSGMFHQYNHNVIYNTDNSKNNGKTVDLILNIKTTPTYSHTTYIIKTNKNNK